MADTIIYEPKGAAKEYNELAINIYRGCAHGCIYCYAPKQTRTPREIFSSPDFIGPRKGLDLAKLDKEAHKLAGDKREILTSFTSDLYQPLERELGLTRKVLQILMRNNLTVTILTKGGCWGLERDMDLLKMNPNNSWGVTLTHDDPDVSLEWEPRAALPEDRIKSLRIAHANGIKTWVSFEPVYDPEAVYRLIETTHKFVDLYKVGKMNHEEKGKELDIDWQDFREKVEAQLQRLGKPYILKDDLLAITDTGTGRVRGEACEIYVNETIADMQAQGKTDAEIGRIVTALLVKKFGGYVKPRTLAQRSTRTRPKSPDDTNVSKGQRKQPKVSPEIIKEATSAFQNLSYPKKKAEEIINYAIESGATTLDDIIRKGLVSQAKISISEAKEKQAEAHPIKRKALSPLSKATNVANAALHILSIIRKEDPDRDMALKQVQDWIRKEAPALAIIYKTDRPPRKLKSKARKIKILTEIGDTKISFLGFSKWLKKH